eukprot:6185458-Pleurochrysis_carterae.AAC.4
MITLKREQTHAGTESLWKIAPGHFWEARCPALGQAQKKRQLRQKSVRCEVVARYCFRTATALQRAACVAASSLAAACRSPWRCP